MLVRNDIGSLLLPGLHKVWGDTYNDYQEEYSQAFKIETSSRSFEQDFGMTSLGLVPTKAEGKAIDYDTAYSGYTTTYTHLSYGLGFIISREMIEDDLYRKVNNLPKALARSNRHTVEILAQNFLNYAFDTTNQPLGDAYSLVNTAHPLVGGGTWSNQIAVSSDLDVTSLEQALIDISLNWIDDRGLKILARPTKLIVPPQLDFQCKMILKSAGLPDTANNNINPAMGILPGGHIVWHWLTDVNAWFIQTDVPNGLTFFWRRRPEFTNDSDFDSENAKFKTTFRCSFGATDPRCIYGSPGSY